MIAIILGLIAAFGVHFFIQKMIVEMDIADALRESDQSTYRAVALLRRHGLEEAANKLEERKCTSVKSK